MLAWIIERVEGRKLSGGDSIGGKPKDGDLYLEGLDLTDEQVTELFAVDLDSWLAEADLTESTSPSSAIRVPAKRAGRLRERLKAAKA